MTFFARSTARFSTPGSQAFILEHSPTECSQRSLRSAPGRLPSPHNRACHLESFHATFTSGKVGVVAAVLKKTELSVARNATQTKALPNLCCRGRLKGANVPGQSGSPCFLSVSQLGNDITNRSVTCAVPGKFSNHLLRTSSAFRQQQKVPLSNVQKKRAFHGIKLCTRRLLYQDSLHLPSGRRVVGPQQWSVLSEDRPFLKENATNQSPSLIAQTTSREKNQGPIKSFGVALQAFILHKREEQTSICAVWRKVS